MLLWILKKKGQSITEYAIIVAALIAGVMAMQGYVRRAMQGKMKAEIDNFAGAGTQYEGMDSTYGVTGASEKIVDATTEAFESKDVTKRRGHEEY